MFFSDTGINIHVISYTFFLKDSSARGFQRWFSIIALASETAPLLKKWVSFVQEMKEIITQLQLMATEVYDREEELCSHRKLRTSILDPSLGASRAIQEMTGNIFVLSFLHSKFSQILFNCIKTVKRNKF